MTNWGGPVQGDGERLREEGVRGHASHPISSLSDTTTDRSHQVPGSEAAFLGESKGCCLEALSDKSLAPYGSGFFDSSLGTYRGRLEVRSFFLLFFGLGNCEPLLVEAQGMASSSHCRAAGK
jgi:hypothetical protein